MAIVVSVGLVVGTGAYFLSQPHLACSCPAEIPLGAYFAVGTVERGGAPNVVFERVTNASPPTGLSLPLTTLTFGASDAHAAVVPVQFVCVVGAQGVVKGIWSGTANAWDHGAPTNSTSCSAPGGPSANVPPGSSTLSMNDSLYFVLGAAAASGTSVWVKANSSEYTGELVGTLN